MPVHSSSTKLHMYTDTAGLRPTREPRNELGNFGGYGGSLLPLHLPSHRSALNISLTWQTEYCGHQPDVCGLWLVLVGGGWSERATVRVQQARLQRVSSLCVSSGSKRSWRARWLAGWLASASFILLGTEGNSNTWVSSKWVGTQQKQPQRSLHGRLDELLHLPGRPWRCHRPRSLPGR